MHKPGGARFVLSRVISNPASCTISFMLSSASAAIARLLSPCEQSMCAAGIPHLSFTFLPFVDVSKLRDVNPVSSPIVIVVGVLRNRRHQTADTNLEDMIHQVGAEHA